MPWADPSQQVYSGLLAQNEITSITREDPFKGEARVYQDGLEVSRAARGEQPGLTRPTCSAQTVLRIAHSPCGSAEKTVTFVKVPTARRSSRPYRSARTPNACSSSALDQRCVCAPEMTVLISRLTVSLRCQLERDVWLWALQLEIERQAHDDPARVVRERTSGLVPEKN